MEKTKGLAFFFFLVFSGHLAFASPSTSPSPSDCPAAGPCKCDQVNAVIRCDGPSLTVHHITFDEIPPLSVTKKSWKLLNASNNAIHAIHDDPFANVSGQLEAIDLSHNVIHKIYADGFRGVGPNLVELYLQGNIIDEFPKAALKGDLKLNKLDLSFNLVRTFEDDAVKWMEDMISLKPNFTINLEGNPFFCDFKLRSFVNLFKKNIKSFEHPHDTKCANPSNLAGRVLGALIDDELIEYTTPAPTTPGPDHVFPPKCPVPHPCWCDYIGNIFCSKGELFNDTVTFTKVPHMIDISSYRWKFLHLSGHQIKTVTPLAFFPLRLQRLSMTNNVIETIQEAAFFGLELELEVLLLEGNRLSTIPDPVYELRTLSILDLSWNDMYEIEQKKVDQLHGMMYSDINGHVHKNQFFASFGGNAYNCSVCEMWYFHRFVQENTENFLDLNLMMCVHAFQEETKYKRIDKLTDDDFPGCPHPTHAPTPEPTRATDNPCPVSHPCWCTFHGDIICSANLLLPPDCPTGRCKPSPPLDDIPKWLDVTNKEHHTAIYLDSNRISKIEKGAFAGILVSKIDLSNNSIAYIYDGAFDGLEGILEELLLSINYLVEVPEAIFILHSMETLDLSFNHIESYHDEAVEKMQEFKYKWIHNGTHLTKTDRRKGIQMRLGSNHLKCDDKICALRSWVDSNPWDFIEETEIYCLEPRKWFGKALHEIDLRDLGCDTSVTISDKLKAALNGKHTMAGLFGFTFLVCICLGAYLFYVSRYKANGIPFRLF